MNLCIERQCVGLDQKMHLINVQSIFCNHDETLINLSFKSYETFVNFISLILDQNIHASNNL